MGPSQWTRNDAGMKRRVAARKTATGAVSPTVHPHVGEVNGELNGLSFASRLWLQRDARSGRWNSPQGGLRAPRAFRGGPYLGLLLPLDSGDGRRGGVEDRGARHRVVSASPPLPPELQKCHRGSGHLPPTVKGGTYGQVPHRVASSFHEVRSRCARAREEGTG